MEQVSDLATSKRRVVVTVHGIRTFGQWQNRLRDLIRKHSNDVIVEPFRYGYFSALAFIFPIFRWFAVLFFRGRLRDLIRQYPDATFTFVAHSFGTHLTIHGLKGLKKDEVPKIDLVLLAGSVLRPNFDWPRFLEKVPVRQVVNDCGINDFVLILSQFAVLLTGMAGRVGFYGFTGGNVMNRFFVGGHGHYFARSRNDANRFMRTYWLPTILQGEVESVDQRSPFGALGGLSNAAIRFSDPLKIVFYGALIWLVYDSLYRQPRLDLIAEQASREVAVAAAAMESDLRLPSSFQSAMRVLGASANIRERELSLAKDVARYAGQRLALFSDALKTLEPQSLFRWSGVAYLATDPPLRLPGSPSWYSRFGSSSKMVTVDADATISLADMESGRIITRQRIGDAGESTIVGDINVLNLAPAPNLIGLEFSVDRPNDDDVSHYAITVDAETGLITTFGGSDTRTSFTSEKDCSAFRVAKDDDDDDDELTPERLQARKLVIAVEAEITSRCISKLLAKPAETLKFPMLTDEMRNWKVLRAAQPANQNEGELQCQSLSESAKFPHVVRHNADTLDFSGAGAPGEPLDRETLENFFHNPDMERNCYVEFQAGGKSYVLEYGFGGAWHISYTLCELEGNAVGKCALPGYAWNGSGDIHLSPDGNMVAVASFGSASQAPWSLTDLRTMRTIDLEDANFGRVSGLAFGANSDVVAVAGSLEGAPGAMRLLVYRVDGKISLLATRTIESSAQPTRPGNEVSPLDDVFISNVGDGFLVATGYGDVFAFQLTDYAPSGSLSRLWSVQGQGSSLSLSFDWVANPLGFAASGGIRYDFDEDARQLLAFDQNRVRLLNAMGGYMMTGAITLSDQGGCGELIQKAGLLGDGRVFVRSDHCYAERAAPPDIQSLSETGGKARAPSLADGTGRQELPDVRSASGGEDVQTRNDDFE
ncbi:hypothetical protein [Ensifer adhaerens]|uniref:Uncharacterized protein n=1 Tax=Ensifer adhaerens TaxID=106592 RepID=A0A9Q9DDG7_ENSAD|nr:hypothetical protein [Ensifer adhaerens]USJ27579.1 hypothetical protein NE863_34730 [Ensifer adhaerens]